jgi:hypothetical protein
MVDNPDVQRAPIPGSPSRRVVTRWLIVGVILAVLLAIAAAAWIGTRAFEAQRELSAARTELVDLKAQALAFDREAASATLERVEAHTSRAVELTSDPVWRAGEVVPWIGPNLSAVRQLAGVTGDLMTEVVGPLIGVSDKLDPATLTPHDGAVDIGALATAAPVVTSAHDAAVVLARTADDLDTSATISQVDEARTSVVAAIGEVMPVLDTLNTLIPLMPPALGADGPRTYLVVVQNPAEARALGGTARSFALLQVDGGRVSLQSVNVAAEALATYPTPVLPLADGADALFGGRLGTSLPNVTLAPSFTTAASLAHEMWARQFGQNVDGVLSIDPTALGYLVGSTGPIELTTGDVLTADSTVPLLLNGVYARYSTGRATVDGANQDRVYRAAVDATFLRLTTGEVDATELVSALVKGWQERRILYWSARPDEQALLGINGETPPSGVGVYFQDDLASKLSYYLGTTVAVTSTACNGDYRMSTAIDLANTVDPAARVPVAIAGLATSQGLPAGTQRVAVLLYAPAGEAVTGVTVDGAAATLESFRDGEHPVARVVVTIAAGASAHLEFTSTGSVAGGLQVTPMVIPPAVSAQSESCPAP